MDRRDVTIICRIQSDCYQLHELDFYCHLLAKRCTSIWNSFSSVNILTVVLGKQNVFRISNYSICFMFIIVPPLHYCCFGYCISVKVYFPIILVHLPFIGFCLLEV